jgi:putative membrane protein
MTNLMDSHRSFLSYLGLTIKGFCMGCADVVPGVSGGTMAFILGIYEELIKAIRSFDLNFLKLILSLKIKDAMNHASWQFLMAVGLGILMAIFSLARILSWLLQNRPILIWSFFFGLILASVYTVSRHLNRWNPSITAWMLLGATGAYLLVGMVPGSTPDAPWFLFISGTVAICAMILPGISGSFILVLMGKYHYVLEAVNNRDLFTLMLVAAGACLGLIIFSRFLNWILKKHHDMTIAILTGLMLGSLRKVWPWKKTIENMTERDGGIVTISQANILPSQWNNEVKMAIGLMVIGFLVVLFMNLWSEKKE